jgi:hypothetical protein
VRRHAVTYFRPARANWENPPLVITPTNDIAARQEEIQDFMSNGDVCVALKRLMDFARDFSEDQEAVHECIVISANYNILDSASRRNIVPTDEVSRQRNVLLYQALGLLDGIVKRRATGNQS